MFHNNQDRISEFDLMPINPLKRYANKFFDELTIFNHTLVYTQTVVGIRIKIDQIWAKSANFSQNRPANIGLTLCGFNQGIL